MNKFDKEIENIIKKVIDESIKTNADDLVGKVKDRILESEMDEGNAFSKMLARTKRGGKFSLKGRKYRDTSGYDSDLYEEDEMEEGNAFSGALAKAKEEGKSSFKVGDKQYSVTENKGKKCPICGMTDCKCNHKKDDKIENKEATAAASAGAFSAPAFGGDMKEVEDRDEFDGRAGKVIGVNANIGDERGEGKYMSDDEIHKFVKNALMRNVAPKKTKFQQLADLMKGKEDDYEDYSDDEYKDHMWIGEEKFIQKATKKMEKKGTTGKFASWCKKEGLDKDGEVTKKCIDKAMKSDDPKVVKMANFAKNIGGFKGAKHESVQMSESELIDLIEELVNESKIPGVYNTDKANKASGNDAKNYYKEVTKKIKDYLKNGSKGKYTENPDYFPKQNGQLAKMDKKAYEPSEAVEEYIDAFSHPGQTNIVYDEIKPDDKRIKDQLEGSAKNGNSQEYANAEKTETGNKFYKNYEENLYGAEQMDASYKRQPQPVDIEGEGKSKTKLPRRKTSAQKAEKVLSQLESMDEKKKNKINKEMSRRLNMV